MKSSNQGSSENFGFHDDEKFKKRFDLYKEIIESGQVVLMKDNLEEMLDECLETGHYSKALFIVNNLLSTFPFDSELWFKRSICYSGRGDREGQTASLRKVLALNPVHTEALVERAKMYIGKNKFAIAKKYLVRAYRINPTDDLVLSGIGFYFLKSKKPANALKYLKKVVQLNPDNIDHYEELANCYEECNKIRKSFMVYEKYTERFPHDEYGWYSRGLQYFRFRRYEMAKESFLKALSVSPGYHDAEVSLAHTYFELGLYTQAYLAYSKLRADHDFPEEVPINLISLFIEQNKFRAALRQAEKLIAKDPGEVSAHTFKAYCLEKIKGRLAAEKYLAGVFNIYENGYFSMVNRPARYYPEESFIRFSRNDKNFKDYHHLESKLLRILHRGYSERKQSAKAAACLATLHSRTKYKPETFFQLALLEMDRGNARRAINYLRRYRSFEKESRDENIIRDRYPDIYFSKAYSVIIKEK